MSDLMHDTIKFNQSRRKNRLSRYFRGEWEGLKWSVKPTGIRRFPFLSRLPYSRGDYLPLKLMVDGINNQQIDQVGLAVGLGENQTEMFPFPPPQKLSNGKQTLSFKIQRLNVSGEYTILVVFGRDTPLFSTNGAIVRVWPDETLFFGIFGIVWTVMIVAITALISRWLN